MPNTPSNNKPLRIMSLPVDTGGCGWYRVRQPLHMIKQFTDSDTHIIDAGKDDAIALAHALTKCDILIARQGSEAGLDRLRQDIADFSKESGVGNGLKAKIVYDIDDNVEYISPYSEHYKSYGLKEFTDKDSGIKVWQDQQNGFFIEDNKKRVASHIKGLQEADLVTVTTEELAKYAREYNDNVAIVPNVIDFERWWELPLKPNTQLRVGWSGGMSHYEDWYSIKKPLNDALRRFRFKLVLVGTGFTGLIDDDLKDLVEVHPWVPFEAHSFHMMAMNLDLAIIPLADLPFNYYKSPIKYFEFSAMGVPSLVADVTPYKEVIHGKHGEPPRALSYNSDEDFGFKLEELLTRSRLRNDLGKNAKAYVTENWSARDWAPKMLDIYRAIL